MDDQGTNREGGDGLRANVWLNGVVILALVVAALNHGIHAWDGGSYLRGGVGHLGHCAAFIY